MADVSQQIEALARSLMRVFEVNGGNYSATERHRECREILVAAWNDGFQAGDKQETFIKHLKDENSAAHGALDRLGAPKTRWVPSRNLDGDKQEITIGLAERINTLAAKGST